MHTCRAVTTRAEAPGQIWQVADTYTGNHHHEGEDQMTQVETVERTDAKRGRRAGKEPAEETAKGPSPAAPRPVKSRRRTWVIALGIAIALVGGLLTWTITTQLSATETLFTTNKPIARGEKIDADDLTTIAIAGGQNTEAIRADNPGDVVGKVAAVDLPAGTLLTPQSFTESLPVPEGEAVVGLALTPAQLPNHPLVAGDNVRVIATPAVQAEVTGEPKTYEATVYTTRFDQANNLWVVDVIVPEEDASLIAAQVATQRVAVVLLESSGE